MIKIERYIDDFSDALPRRRSPLLSLERVAGDPRSKARTAEDRERKGPPSKGGTVGQPARIRSNILLSESVSCGSGSV